MSDNVIPLFPTEPPAPQPFSCCGGVGEHDDLCPNGP